MGYRMNIAACATCERWRKKTGAGGALGTAFAPLRHLRHPLMGKGRCRSGAHTPRVRIPQHRRHTSRWRLRLAGHALAFRHGGGARTGGVFCDRGGKMQ
jgi:hypothetical protein